MGELKVLDELLIRRCFFERVEVLSVQVLDQCLLQRVRVVSCFDDRRHAREAGALGGTPTTLPCDELVAVLTFRWADQNWLQNAHFPHRSRQRGQ